MYVSKLQTMCLDTDCLRKCCMDIMKACYVGQGTYHVEKSAVSGQF